MRKVILVLCMLFSAVLTTFAQSRQVTGKVVDKGGEPLIGVSVALKGASTGVSTDAKGSFKLNVPSSGNPVLVFKYVGFKSKEVVVGQQTDLKVIMEEDSKSLSEVVVMGYTTIAKKDLTGSVSSITGDVIEKNPVSSVAEALTGRLPGVQVTTSDGAPGAEIVIRVRGGGSVTQDNSPLYIVDGFPVSSINDIATTDIERIDVLKDASATAIYGARGANGVVIVTTKSAKSGKTNVTYNAYGQGRTFPRKLDVLSPYEYVLAQYEYAKLQGTSALANFTKYFGVYDDLELYKYQQGTDWQEQLFGKTAWSQQHNLSVTGGTDKTKMALSFTHNDEDGIMVGSGYKRSYLNFKLNHDVSKSLKLDLGLRFSNETTRGAGTSGTSSVRVSQGITTRPVNGLADQIQIDPTTDEDYDNFLASLVSPSKLVEQDYRRRINRGLVFNGGVSWKILKNLNYKSSLAYSLSDGDTRRYWGSLTSESAQNGGNLPLGELTKTTGNSYKFSNTLNYTLKNKFHSSSFLLGQEIIGGNTSSDFTRAKYFEKTISPERMFANMGLGTMDRISTEEVPISQLSSFFGQANYSFQDKYLATATLRADGSSLFAEGNKWGYFPAFSLGWKVSEESFLKSIPQISELKLRFSYGAVGNNRLNNNMYREMFNISTTRAIGYDNVSQPYWTTSSSTTMVNPNIKWETTITRNAGLDFGLFRGKLTGALDFYKNTTKDLLVQVDIAPYNGYTSLIDNIGQTSNKGIELSLSGSIIKKKDFNLSANFNIGINRANIDNLGGVKELALKSNWASTDLKGVDDYKVIVGQTIGLMYGYVTDGYYTVDDFESYNPTTDTYTLKSGVPNNSGVLGQSKLRPGYLKYQDLNGDGLVESGNDRKLIGSALPKNTGGFGFNGNYKAWDFSTLFNWSYGNDIYNTGRIEMNMPYRTTYGNMLNTVNSANRFKYIDDAGNLVTNLEALRTLNQNANIWSPFSMASASPSLHSWAVEDGSFLRLSNVTVGYTLPKRVTRIAGIAKLRFYGTVYNAFLWTKYSGYDPEVSSSRNSSYNQLIPGVDYSAYPKSRTYTMGVNVTF